MNWPNGFILLAKYTRIAIAVLSSVRPGPSAARIDLPKLEISLPASGTVVSPGSAINVVVTSPAGTSFAHVSVTGESPLASADQAATEVPSRFSVSIPADAFPGKYRLTAMGQTVEGQLLESAPILIDVESPEAPIRLTSDPMEITFPSQGQQSQLRISGSYSDGSVVNVSGSSRVIYASSDDTIVVVTATGQITGVGPGSALVTATYVEHGAELAQVTVPISVPPPVIIASPSSLNFDDEPVGEHSTEQVVTISNASSERTLEIKSIDIIGDFSAINNCITSTPLAPGSSCAIKVTSVPRMHGSRSGEIHVDNSFTMEPVVVKLTGSGVSGVARP
jgi:hypothetical protein